MPKIVGGCASDTADQCVGTTVAIWCPGIRYEAGAVVSYLGVFYIAKADNSCSAKDNSQNPTVRTDLWSKLA